MIRIIVHAAGFVRCIIALTCVIGLSLPGQGFAADPNDDPSCGGHIQPQCQPPVSPACDTAHFALGDLICATPFADATPLCGGARQAACAGTQTFCDSGIWYRAATSSCHHPDPNHSSNFDCGGHNQPICRDPIFPTCDSGHAQEGFLGPTCVEIDPNLNSNCGGHDQAICPPPYKKTCDDGIAERLGANTCHNPDPNASVNDDCGGNKQPICELPIFPTCDSNRVQRSETGTCHNTNPNASGNQDCGGDGQLICVLPVSPTCDSGNIQDGNRCYTPRSCGGEGERACCGITGETQWHENPIPLSAGCFGGPGGGVNNLVELAGNAPHPAVCGGDNPLALKSNGRCVACGSEGARICVGSNVAAQERCGPGLTDDGFGFCTPCGGGEGERVCAATAEGEWLCDPGLHPDFGICVADATIPEPDCNCEPGSTTGDADAPVRGYADLHLHLFSNLAFGGMTLWGEVYDPQLGISGALRADNYAQRTSDYLLN